MIGGEFSPKGELIFEVGLIAADNSLIFVEALLDTGFTSWLLVNDGDAIELGWERHSKPKRVLTADGIATLNVYRSIVLLDGEELLVTAYGGYRVKEILLGVQWLRSKRLVVDFAEGILTLG